MDAETRAEIAAMKAQLAHQAAVIADLKLSRAQRTVQAIKRNKRLAAGLISVLIAIPVSLYTLNITKTHTFTAGNPTVASEVNTNFDQLFTKVNDLAAYHPPIGTILAWHKSFPNTPILPLTNEWVECNGQLLIDAQSPYNNQTIPNLNGSPGGADSPGQSAKVAMFLRGGLISGTGQQDAFQGHLHEYYGFGAGGGAGVVDAPAAYFLGNPSSLSDLVTACVIFIAVALRN
jgi:hypothetical protein